MLGILLLIAAAIAMGRFAEADRGEGTKWGLITFGICLVLSFVIPIPLIPIGLGCIITFVLMTVMKKTFY
jgi:hypothetical protein